MISITAGKQRIAWGTGYIWNPTDIFNSYVLSFAVKDAEEANVEAVRAEIPIGQMGLFDGYVSTGNEWDKTQKGIRVKNNYDNFDCSLSFTESAETGGQYGFDVAGDLSGIGIRSEIAVKQGSCQFVLGGDYTFENGLYLNLESFFDSSGSGSLEAYNWSDYFAGKIKHLGKNYIYLGLSKSINEITQIKNSAIINLNDLSFILYPQYSRNIMENLDLSLESLLTFGQRGSEFHPGTAIDPTGFLGSKMGLVRLIYSF